MKFADEAEARFNQEEPDKRVDQQGDEIGFSYDQEQAGDNNSSSEITLRPLATAIEKTSEFITTQGTQKVNLEAKRKRLQDMTEYEDLEVVPAKKPAMLNIARSDR